MELSALTIHEVQELFAKGEASSVEVTTAVFDRMAAVEPKVAAYITENRDEALAKAAEADTMLKAGEGGALCGIPLRYLYQGTAHHSWIENT